MALIDTDLLLLSPKNSSRCNISSLQDLDEEIRNLELAGCDLLGPFSSDLPNLSSNVKEQKIESEVSRDSTQGRRLIEDLERELRIAVATKESAARIRERELAEKDRLLANQRLEYEQLELNCKSQEKLLDELNEKVMTQQREKHVIDSSLNDIRRLLINLEHSRGHLFNKSMSALQQDTLTLIQSISLFIQQINAENCTKEQTIQQLRSEAEYLQCNSIELKRLLLEDYEQRLSEQLNEHKMTLMKSQKETESAKHENESLGRQVEAMRRQLEERNQEPSMDNTSLQQQLKSYKEKQALEINLWKDKRQELEAAVELMSNELRSVTLDRNRYKESYEDLKSQLLTMEEDREKLSQRLQKVRRAEELCVVQETELELLMRERDSLIEDLRRQLTNVQLGCEERIMETVTQREVEKALKEHIESVTLQLSTISETCKNLELDLRSERISKRDLQEVLDLMQTKYQSIFFELKQLKTMNGRLTAVTQESEKQINQLIADKALCENECKSLNLELKSLQLCKDKLLVQLEEMENNFWILQEENNEIKRQIDLFKEESKNQAKDKMNADQVILAENNSKFCEIKKENESLLKKIRSLEDEALAHFQMSSASDLQTKQLKINMANLLKEKDILIEQLDSERQKNKDLKKTAEESEEQFEREFAVISEQLNVTSHDLQLSKRALQVHDDVDIKAVEVARRMQEEVIQQRQTNDRLNSEVRDLRDRFDVQVKEKEVAEQRMLLLSDRLIESEKQNKSLAEEWHNSVVRCTDLETCICDLKQTLNKMSGQTRESLNQAEVYAQDIIKLKLQHQIQLQDRLLNNRRHHSNSGDSVDSTTRLADLACYVTKSDAVEPLQAPRLQSAYANTNAGRGVKDTSGASQEDPVRDMSVYELITGIPDVDTGLLYKKIYDPRKESKGLKASKQASKNNNMKPSRCSNAVKSSARVQKQSEERTVNNHASKRENQNQKGITAGLSSDDQKKDLNLRRK